MKRAVTLLSTIGLAAMLSGGVLAQGKPQTVSLVRVDMQSVAKGFRASKVLGGTVVNDANETVGKIDDLIVTPNEQVPFAVLSVGGFLGMGSKYVVVPYSSLQVRDNKIVLPGATKDALKALPEFKYAT
jgi:sporulation protein YlmC with PRC-barrel domain